MVKALLTCVLVVARMSGVPHAQDRSWRTYSPPGSSFSVELPAPLRRVMSFEGEHGASLEPDQEMKGAHCYAAIETTPGDSRFGVIAFKTSALRKVFRSTPREEFLVSLSYTFLADDDETQYLRAPVEIKHNGLRAREYFYVKASEHPHGSALYTRGRIYDVGGNIYVTVFVGRNAQDLTSPDAERFLNSFRLLRRHKRCFLYAGLVQHNWLGP